MRFAIAVGAAGGFADVGAGILVLANSMGTAAMSSTMSATWAGLLLVALGGAVLATTVAMAVSASGSHRPAFGGLMLAYGVLMLVVGGAMFLDLVPMMSGALWSGAAMVLLGIGMLYSGATMSRM